MVSMLGIGAAMPNQASMGGNAAGREQHLLFRPGATVCSVGDD